MVRFCMYLQNTANRICRGTGCGSCDKENDDSKVFELSNQKDEVPFTEVGKTAGVRVMILGRKVIKSSV